MLQTGRGGACVTDRHLGVRGGLCYRQGAWGFVGACATDRALGGLWGDLWGRGLPADELARSRGRYSG